MGLFSEEVVKKTKEVLKDLRDPVGITYFTQETECEICRLATSFVDELAAVDGRIEVEKKDFVRDGKTAEKLGVHHIPAMALRKAGGDRSPIRYFGVPGGYEFGAFLHTLVMLSTGKTAEGIEAAAVAEIDRDINLKVFVLTTCPSCPAMVYLCNSLALLNSRVTVEVIEANSFVDLATRFTVSTVPKVVVNDTVEIVGSLSATELIDRIKSSG